MIRESPVLDETEMAEYRQSLITNRPQGHGMTRLALYGQQQALEGSPPDAIGILAFPSMEEAKSWYESAEYQAAVKHRLKAADFRTVIVEGL